MVLGGDDGADEHQPEDGAGGWRGPPARMDAMGKLRRRRVLVAGEGRPTPSATRTRDAGKLARRSGAHRGTDARARRRASRPSTTPWGPGRGVGVDLPLVEGLMAANGGGVSGGRELWRGAAWEEMGTDMCVQASTLIKTTE